MLKYKDYKLVIPDAALAASIDNLIRERNGSVFHGVELNRIVERRFNTSLYYLVDNPEAVTEAAVVHVVRKRAGLKQYVFRPLFDIPYGGFIGKGEIDTAALKTGPFEAITYTGFPYKKKAGEEGGGETAIVDLSLSEDSIFSDIITSSRRNMIRKAVNAGITVIHYFDQGGFDILWPMISRLHDRLGVSSMPETYYRDIFRTFAPKQQACILIAFRDDEALSGIFLLGNSNYMHYYKGASLSDENEGQGELLQWEAIKLCKVLGVARYDLCNLDKNKLPDIYRFKTGISREIYGYQTHYYRPLPYKLLNKLFPA